MPALRTTVGQLLVNESLPEDMRDYNRVLDKKGLSDLLAEVAKNQPEKYREISHKLGRVGFESAFRTGGNSFGLAAMRQAKVAKERRKLLAVRVEAILNDDSLSDDGRDKQLILAAGDVMGKERDEIFDESIAENNPLALQLKGARLDLLAHVQLHGGVNGDASSRLQRRWTLDPRHVGVERQNH